MADVLSYNLTHPDDEQRGFDRPDLSTKLKLLGVDVASFGDFFADRDGPKYLPGRRLENGKGMGSRQKTGAPPSNSPMVKALTYKDPFAAVYKKYLFTMDGKHVLGGMMIGDTKDYAKLNQMVKSQKVLEVPPSQFILGSHNGGEENGDDLYDRDLFTYPLVALLTIYHRDDETQICSCHNVTKGDVISSLKEQGCKTISEVKSCTKAGTGCGGCMPLVQSIFNKSMLEMGQEVSNHRELLLCPYSYHVADYIQCVLIFHILAPTFITLFRSSSCKHSWMLCKPLARTLNRLDASSASQLSGLFSQVSIIGMLLINQFVKCRTQMTDSLPIYRETGRSLLFPVFLEEKSRRIG